MASDTEPKADSERKLQVIDGGLDEQLRELERLLYDEAADEVSRWARIIYIASRIDRRGTLHLVARRQSVREGAQAYGPDTCK